MQFVDKLHIPGEHFLILEGKVGQLEAVLTVPAQIDSPFVVILGHPHSLQGGTMNNKVVTTMARVFKELHIPALRFNFRGVGQSEGSYDEGIGESEDMVTLVKQWQTEQADRQFIFAGFSFGSYVAYRASATIGGSPLITIAPPVHHYDYNAFQPAPKPWLIVQGDEDEVVPAKEVLSFASKAHPPIQVIEFPKTGHFFHGKLIELKQQLLEYVQLLVHRA